MSGNQGAAGCTWMETFANLPNVSESLVGQRYVRDRLALGITFPPPQKSEVHASAGWHNPFGFNRNSIIVRWRSDRRMQSAGIFSPADFVVFYRTETAAPVRPQAVPVCPTLRLSMKITTN